MIVYCATPTWTNEAHMRGNRFLPTIQRHHGVGRLEPQFLADQPIRDRVKTLLELNMSVTVHLPLSPNCELRRDVWQADQQASFGLREALQGHLARSAVNPVAGLVHHPGVYLAVGVSKATELA
jgi:hypothetical protein